MFCDSKIAEKFASGKMKTTAVLKYALAPVRVSSLAVLLPHSRFDVTVGIIKQTKIFGIIVRYWDRVA